MLRKYLDTTVTEYISPCLDVVYTQVECGFSGSYGEEGAAGDGLGNNDNGEF